MTDLTTLTDADLADLISNGLNEQSRRRQQADIPIQVANLSKAFVAGGGDLATIQTAVAESTATPVTDTTADAAAATADPPATAPTADSTATATTDTATASTDTTVTTPIQ